MNPCFLFSQGITHIFSREIFSSLLFKHLLRVVHEVGEEDVEEVVDEHLLLLVRLGPEHSNPLCTRKDEYGSGKRKNNKIRIRIKHEDDYVL